MLFIDQLWCNHWDPVILIIITITIINIIIMIIMIIIFIIITKGYSKMNRSAIIEIRMILIGRRADG